MSAKLLAKMVVVRMHVRGAYNALARLNDVGEQRIGAAAWSPR